MEILYRLFGNGTHSKQQRTAFLGALIVGLMILFPVYYDTGGLLGGIRFGFLFKPLQWDLGTDSRPNLALNGLLLQILTVACWTLILILVQNERATKAQRIALRIGLVSCIALTLANFLPMSTSGPKLLWLVFPILITGHYLLFLRLSILSAISLVAVFLLRNSARIPNSTQV